MTTDGPSSADGIGRQWASPVLDGDVYAQPLVAGERIVVATENDTVYSVHASDGTVEWMRHLGDPVKGSSLPCGNVDPVGITSTPVIDTAANRVYAVGMVEPAQHMLWVLDLATGELVASTRIDAEGADPKVQNQRGALSLSNGRVFVPYGGRFGDCGEYRGRVVSVAVTGSGLGPVASYTLPVEGEGGFWAPPGASVGSDGSLYLANGNTTSTDTYDYGNSVVRLSSDLRLVDSFAPTDWAALNDADVDLGTTGPVLLPANRVFQVGKSGIGYLLDSQHLGGVGGQLYDARVCSVSAFGAVAHDADTLFVPCLDGVVQITVSGDRFAVGWTAALDTPGPTIVTSDAVWTVATGAGDLIALDPTSGRTITREHLGDVPSRFSSPAAAGGRIIVAADRTVFSYGH